MSEMVMEHSNMFSNKMPFRILWSLHTFQEKTMRYWPIPNNHCVLSNLIQAKIRFCYFIATFWSVFYIFYFQNLLLLYHIGMPIPYLKKSGIKNPKLITQVVRTIQHSAFGVVLDWPVQLSWIVLDFAIQDFWRYGIAPILCRTPLNLLKSALVKSFFNVKIGSNLQKKNFSS